MQKFPLHFVMLLILSCNLFGCGQTGPLFMPPPTPVETKAVPIVVSSTNQPCDEKTKI